MKKEESLKKRYFYKLLSNIVAIPVTLLVEMIIPRGLGPIAYGNFNFITILFSRIIGFFDSGTSMAFYTKLSKRQTESKLVKFYWQFVGVVGGVLILLLFSVIFTNKQDLLLPNQEVTYIWLGLLFCFLTWIVNISSKIVDAHGYTIAGEKIQMLQKILAAFTITVLFLTNSITLINFFLYNYIILLFLYVGWWRILRKNNVALFPMVKISFTKTKAYIVEFYNYCHPLIAYALVGMLVSIFDIWLLQKFAGSIEQGFFGLAFKVAAVSFLFAKAMTPLITREFSIAFSKKDITKLRKLFSKYLPMLHVLVAFIAMFFVSHASTITLLFGGKEFKNATTAVAIMGLYPIGQTYGQLSGGLYYATNQTKLYRNIGSTIMLIGIVFTIILLFPSKYWGLNLGSTGLALKTVLVQFLSINVGLWFNTKYLKISFLKFLIHELCTIIVLGIFAYMALTFAKMLSTSIIISFLTSGIIYSILGILLVLVFPQVVVISRKELFDFLEQFKRFILKKLNL